MLQYLHLHVCVCGHTLVYETKQEMRHRFRLCQINWGNKCYDSSLLGMCVRCVCAFLCEREKQRREKDEMGWTGFCSDTKFGLLEAVLGRQGIFDFCVWSSDAHGERFFDNIIFHLTAFFCLKKWEKEYSEVGLWDMTKIPYPDRGHFTSTRWYISLLVTHTFSRLCKMALSLQR